MENTSEPVAGPSRPFTRRKKRLLDEGLEPPRGKREELDFILSQDPLDISLEEPNTRPIGNIPSQLLDEDYDELRHEVLYESDSVSCTQQCSLMQQVKNAESCPTKH